MLESVWRKNSAFRISIQFFHQSPKTGQNHLTSEFVSVCETEQLADASVKPYDAKVRDLPTMHRVGGTDQLPA